MTPTKNVLNAHTGDDLRIMRPGSGEGIFYNPSYLGSQVS